MSYRDGEDFMIYLRTRISGFFFYLIAVWAVFMLGFMNAAQYFKMS